MEEKIRLATHNIIILVIHDECIFSVYNKRHWLKMPKGKQPLCKKNQERSVHKSEFLTDVGGHLILYKENKFSGTKALFVFDNATSHCIYAEDALLAKNINLSPDDKQPKM
ncbi:12398_t:CDS:2, partial [Cetraspora pellucida]